MSTTGASARLLLVLVACWAQAGCAKKDDPQATAKQILEKHRASLIKQQSAIVAVQALAKKRPALKPLEGHPQRAQDIVVLDEDVLPDRYVKRTGCWPYFSQQNTFMLLANDPNARPFNDETDLTALENAKLSLVCRVENIVRPVVDDQAQSFSGGTGNVECRMYSLETMAYLGGFSRAASIRGQVQYRGTAAAGASAVDSALPRALNSEVTAALSLPAHEWYYCDFSVASIKP